MADRRLGPAIRAPAAVQLREAVMAAPVAGEVTSSLRDVTLDAGDFVSGSENTDAFDALWVSLPDPN